MNNHPHSTIQPFTLKDHRPSESTFSMQKAAVFNRAQAPAPASYQMNQKRNHHLHNNNNNNNNFANQQSQQQKQILNQLLQANAASTNQIQRSMNVNSNNMNQINQLSHLKLPQLQHQQQQQQNQRAVHIPKQQLIQHIQMLSNLNSKHTFPQQQQFLNQQQQQPNFVDLNSIANPTLEPDQYAELSQMMDVKLPANYQEQSIRNFQQANSNMNNMNNNQNPTKPQIHYADASNPFSESSNVNPTNQPPPSPSNLQAAESVGHSQHSPSSNLLSVGDSSNSAVVNFDMKDPPGGDKGVHMSFGSGPSGGGSSIMTNPLGIFKSLFLPLLPKPRMNLNGNL